MLSQASHKLSVIYISLHINLTILELKCMYTENPM